MGASRLATLPGALWGSLADQEEASQCSDFDKGRPIARSAVGGAGLRSPSLPQRAESRVRIGPPAYVLSPDAPPARRTSFGPAAPPPKLGVKAWLMLILALPADAAFPVTKWVHVPTF